jgi:hypothetical protein
MAENPDLRAIVDRQQIHDALARYTRGVDRLDEALIDSAYHADAEDFRAGADVPGFLGAEAGKTLVGRLRAGCDASSHLIGNVTIELDGDRAWVESYYDVWQTKASSDGASWLHVRGRYVDRFERRAGAWRIARREVLTDLVDSSPGARSIAVTGRRSRDDASYALRDGAVR